MEIPVSEPGFLYLYVSNENQENVTAFFDDFHTEHVLSAVSFAVDYYPFGLQMAGRQHERTKYRFGYQGEFAEEDQETGWNHFELREYDPVIGRTMVPDPARQFYSGYQWVGNDPVNQVDPTGGICPKCPGGSEYDVYRNDDAMFNYADGVGAFYDIGEVAIVASRSFDEIQRVMTGSRVDYLDIIGMMRDVGNMEAMVATFNPDNVGSILFLAEAGAMGSGKGPNTFSMTARGVNNVGQGYRSFSALKRAIGPAGKGRAWHHIVEQTPGNVQRFGAQTIHNTNNVVNVAHGAGTVHARISGYYSSIRRFTNGQTVRKWLSTQSFDDQYKFGVDVMNRINNGVPLR